jgi:methyl-accepting chemotaxis protein
MSAKIAEVKEWFQELTFIKSNVEIVKDDATKSFKAIESGKEQAEKVMEDIQEILEKIVGYERTANNAKENVDSSASMAKVNSDSVTKLAANLKDAVEEKDKLFEEFEMRRDEIAQLLESANR